MSGLALALAAMGSMLSLGLFTFFWTFGVVMSQSGWAFLVLIGLLAAFLATGLALRRWVLPAARRLIDAGRHGS